MANIFGSGNTSDKLFGVKLNSSELGNAVTVVMGTAKTNQNIFWIDGFTASPDGGKKGGGGGGGGKGGGKGDGQYLYSANVVVGLTAGPILGIGDVWTGQSWLGSPKANESYTIASPYTYTPTASDSLVNDYGVTPTSTYSRSYSDYNAPAPTTVSNTTAIPFAKVAYGSTLNSGEYSVSPSGVYNFSSANAGTTVSVNYSFLLTTINNQENDIVPAGLTIQVGGNYQFNADLGVVYGGTGANTGNALTRVNGTPSSAGTYSVSGSAPATYRFAAADQAAQVTITYQINNPNAIGQNESTMLDFTLAEGNLGQSPYSFLSGSYPGAALGYSGIATLLYEPMDLGMGGEPQENSFEVITPGINGGSYANGTPILDCNPVYCMTEVLTNSQWGLGVGAIPFPTSFIDSASWGGPGTAGVQSVSSSAWNWFASNSFFISPVLDSQDTAASAMSKWLEAGMCAAFVSEGLLKLVPYGDTSQAANGYTWTAPSQYVAALDDTCFIAKDGADPVTIKRSAWQDAYNTVQVQWDNRGNQYAPEVTQESDQSLIDRFGSRIEDPQDWDFIHTLTAATFAANMRLKRGTYIRNTYEFTLPFTYSYLEPMDLVTHTSSSVWAAGINNTNLGVTNLPVRITKVVDDPAEGIKIEAEDYPFGAGQPTLFNKGQSAAEVVSDTMAYPGTSEVVMFEAQGRLVNYGGNQIWMGACGTSENYGSTNVWVSQDNVNYVQVATIDQPAVIGELASTFASGGDPDTTNSLVVQLAENSAALVSGTQQAADNDTMLCYVDGEIISYSAASLTGQNTYTLSTYIRRGQLGTPVSPHAAGSLFIRIDGSVVKYTYDPTWQGKTVYFKFQPVNSFGNNPTPLSSLTAVAFTISDTNSGAVDAETGLVLQGFAGISDNLVPNSDFTMGNRGWLGVTTTPPVVGPVIISPSFGIQPGHNYQLNFTVSAVSGAPNCLFRIYWGASYYPNITDQSELTSAGYADMFYGTPTAQTYTLEWTAPAGMYYASLGVFDLTGNTTSVTISRVSVIDYGAAAQWGADVTGSNTAADTANVNGVGSHLISPIAGLMPAQAGADVTGLNTANNTNNVGSVSASDIEKTILSGGGVDFYSSHNINFPQNLANLVKTGAFSGGSTGAWGRPTVSVSGQATFTQALFTQSRDTNEGGNNITVVPGQLLYMSAWLNTSGATGTTGSFGVELNGPSVGTNWTGGAVLAPGQGWTFCAGVIEVPAGYNVANPWLQLNYDGDGSQTLLAAELYIGTTPTAGGYRISTPFRNQGGMIATYADVNFQANVSDSTIAVWNTAESLPFPDGSFISVPATGSSGAPAWTFGGLAASTTYYLSAYYTIATNTVHVIMSDVSGGTAPPSAAQQIQVVNGDGNIGLLVGWGVSTTAPGGFGGGTPPPPPTCPADDQIMETLESGFVPAREIEAGMHVRDAEGGWNLVHQAWSEEAPLHFVTILSPDGESETYHVDLNHRWLAPGGDSLADIYSDNWIRSETLSVGDGVQGSDGKVHHVSAISEPHPGKYRKIICERQRMRLGKLIAHNFLTNQPPIQE